MNTTVRIHVSGEFACFTRPEAKVERMSYPVPTPSAARNILDSICWRPEMRWLVTSISLLKPIRYIAIRRNELQSKLAPSTVKKWMGDPSTYTPLAAGAGQDTDGTPRGTVALADVAFLIEARPIIFNANGDNTHRNMLLCSCAEPKRGNVIRSPTSAAGSSRLIFAQAGRRTHRWMSRKTWGGCSMTLLFAPKEINRSSSMRALRMA